MPKFSEDSKKKLETCCTELQVLFNTVIKHVDCTVICGYRNEQEQNEAFIKGNSKLKYPESKHNKIKSKAIDVLPYPIDWNDNERNYMFIGFVKGIAASMDLNIRSGADWDSDFDLKDNKFNDLPHFELIEI